MACSTPMRNPKLQAWKHNQKNLPFCRIFEADYSYCYDVQRGRSGPTAPIRRHNNI